MKDIMNNLTVEEVDVQLALSEPDIFCFVCGTTFSFMEGCECSPTANLETWVIKPSVLDSSVWFAKNTCVISSFDGSFDVMSNRPFGFQDE